MTPTKRHEAIGQRIRNERLFMVLTPIFDGDMGRRLQTARMAMLLDQKELGDRLGVSQQIISKLERGTMKVSKFPFNVARMMAMLGDKHASYVLLGINKSSYDPALIRRRYWDERLKVKRKPGSGSVRKQQCKLS